MVEILTKTLIAWEQFTNLVRTEVSCNSDLVQHPNPRSFAADVLEGEREQCPFGTCICSPRQAQQAPEFFNPVSHGPRIPIHTCGGISAYGTWPALQTALLVCTPFQVSTMKIGERALNQEDFMRQLMLVAWFRWWWPLVTSRPQPPRGFRAAGGDFFAACCTQHWRGLMQLAVPKRSCDGSLFSRFTQLLSVFPLI